MPRDANGVVADIAVLSRGVVARTNMGVLYEQYFTASARQMKNRIMDLLKVEKSNLIGKMEEGMINTTFKYLLQYLSLHNTTQYKLYSGIIESTKFVAENDLTKLPIGGLTNAQKVEILKEIHSKELYIVYNAAEEETMYDIVNRLEDSQFKLDIVPVYIKDPITKTFKEMRSRSFIAPVYTVMLNKITDSFLAADSFFLNGHGLATGKSKEDGRYGYKYKSVKAGGESETRLYASYGTPRLIQKIADRAKSIQNHRIYIANQLATGTVTNYDLIPNRVEDSDVAINIVKAVLEPAGVTIVNDPITLNKEV